MKIPIALLAWAFAIMLVAVALRGQSGNPVSVKMAWPTNGMTLTGTVTLTAFASSLAAPIDRVEFYETYCVTNAQGQIVCQTNLIGVATNQAKMTTPKSLFVY